MVLNLSKFSWGTGFIILGVGVIGGGGCLASILFGGIYKIIGK